MVTMSPLTEHTKGEALVSETVKPESAVASTLKGEAENSLSEGAEKSTTCVALPLTVTVTSALLACT
jgi:hypothetical protein